MPDVSKVGGLTLPITAEQSGEQLADPMVKELLARSAHAIRLDLTNRFRNIRPVGSITDPVPPDNMFPFNPMEPRGIKVKLPLPALFIWWEGDSRWKDWSQLKWLRERDLHLMYVFTEPPQIEALTERVGVLNAVDACLFKMSQRRVYPTYEDNRTAADVIGGRCAASWQWMGGRMGRFGIDEGPNAERRAKKRSGRDWPALKGRFMVKELVEPRMACDPDDANIEGQAVIHGNDYPLLERVLEGWDGYPDE